MLFSHPSLAVPDPAPQRDELFPDRLCCLPQRTRLPGCGSSARPGSRHTQLDCPHSERRAWSWLVPRRRRAPRHRGGPRKASYALQPCCGRRETKSWSGGRINHLGIRLDMILYQMLRLQITSRVGSTICASRHHNKPLKAQLEFRYCPNNLYRESL